MGTIPMQFSAAFDFEGFNTVAPTGTSNNYNFPNRPVGMVRFKADPGNSATVYLGLSATTANWPMAAGDDTGWVSTANLARYVYRGATGSQIHYWWQR